jgi:hypothetical protein
MVAFTRIDPIFRGHFHYRCSTRQFKTIAASLDEHYKFLGKVLRFAQTQTKQSHEREGEGTDLDLYEVEAAAESSLHRFSSPLPVQIPVPPADSQSNPRVEDVERFLHLLFLILPPLSLLIPYRRSCGP